MELYFSDANSSLEPIHHYLHKFRVYLILISYKGSQRSTSTSVVYLWVHRVNSFPPFGKIIIVKCQISSKLFDYFDHAGLLDFVQKNVLTYILD